MTHNELLNSISSSELMDWVAFYNQEEEMFLEERLERNQQRTDIGLATLNSMYYNVNRDDKKTTAKKPQDFLPKFNKRAKPEMLAQKVNILRDVLGKNRNKGKTRKEKMDL